MKHFDIVVIGAGCAGLMTAQLLAKKNYSVALLDRKKDLLNLSFLTLGSFMDINKYGLSEKVIASKIETGAFYSKNLSVVKTAHNVAIIDKTQLHRELLEKCKHNGVEIFKDTLIDSIEQDSDGSISSIKAKNGNQFQARIFVDATGTTGLISKLLGLQEKSFPLAVGLEYDAEYRGDPHQAIFFIGPEYAGGYGWIFPLGKQRAIVGFGTFNPEIRSNLKKGLSAIVADPRVRDLITIDDPTTFGGNIPITGVNTTLHQHNVICVGDSVSQVNPLVGEGYKFIMDSALLAESAIDQAIKQNDLTLLSDYEKSWEKANVAHYKNSKMLQSLLAKGHQSNLLTDIGLLFLKLKRSKTVSRIVSGEFLIWDLLLP